MLSLHHPIPVPAPAVNAVEAEFVPLSADWLPSVMRVENSAYSHPWTEVNFHDALRSGYQAQLLVAGGQLLGYFVAMRGVAEVLAGRDSGWETQRRDDGSVPLGSLVRRRRPPNFE